VIAGGPLDLVADETTCSQKIVFRLDAWRARGKVVRRLLCRVPTSRFVVERR